MTKTDITYRLRRLREDLADPKWSTWTYTEGSEMYGDLQDHVATLDVLINAVRALPCRSQ